MRLENKIALLCGVGRGMGKAVAMLYAQEGATVVLNARTTTHLEKTASEIKSFSSTLRTRLSLKSYIANLNSAISSLFFVCLSKLTPYKLFFLDLHEKNH